MIILLQISINLIIYTISNNQVIFFHILINTVIHTIVINLAIFSLIQINPIIHIIAINLSIPSRMPTNPITFLCYRYFLSLFFSLIFHVHFLSHTHICLTFIYLSFLWVNSYIIMRLVSIEFKRGYIKFYYIIFHHNYFIIYLLHLVLISFSMFFYFQVLLIHTFNI